MVIEILRCCLILSERYDFSGYPFDPILTLDENKTSLTMESKGYPETSYLPYNISQLHNPNELQHQFHRCESLRSQQIVSFNGSLSCKVYKAWAVDAAVVIHSFRSLPRDKSMNSSKTSSPQTASWRFLLQFSVHSRFLKVIQWLLMSSSSSSRHLEISSYIAFTKVL